MCKARLTIVIDFKDNCTEKIREVVAKLETESLQGSMEVEPRHVTNEDIISWTFGSDSADLECDVHYSDIVDMA